MSTAAAARPGALDLRSPRRSVRIFSLALAGGLGMIAGFNWLVNPWRLYSTQLLPARVIDLRGRKCRLLRAFEPPPRQILLGSSRAMRFEPAYLERRTGLRSFNMAIPGGNSVDALVLARHALEDRRAPLRRAIVAVEATTLSGLDLSYPFIDLDPSLRRYLPGARPSPGHALPQLLSSAQTRDSVAAVRRAVRSGRVRLNDYLDPDGWERESPAQAARRGSRQVEGLAGPRPVEPAAVEHFDELLRRLRARRVETVVVATPVLDILRDRWRADGSLAHEAEALSQLRALAARHGARFVDFSRVEQFGSGADEFYDGYHPTVVATRRMIDRLFPAATLSLER